MVSVIIPVYNGEKYVTKCVESVLNQSMQDYEIILVDDGSTDNSASICNDLAVDNSKIRVFHQKNMGVSAARNTGLANSCGDFVTFLDADDMLTPNALEHLVIAMNENSADMTLGRLVHVMPPNTYKQEDVSFDKIQFEGTEFLEAAIADHPFTYYSCRVLYRKSFIQDISFEEGRITGEDSFFIFQCALKQPKVVAIDHVVYEYIYNPSSATNVGLSKKKYNDIVYFMNRKIALINKNYPKFSEKARNLNVKTNMLLLRNLCNVFDCTWKSAEKECLTNFYDNKNYFLNATKDNERWFLILSNHLYHPYKISRRIVKMLKSLLQR